MKEILSSMYEIRLTGIFEILSCMKEILSRMKQILSHMYDILSRI